MSLRRVPASRGALSLATILALLTSGCSYDYLQHTDRVAYRAGDAVKANLEGETINPRKRSRYMTWGLGANGYVLSPAAATTPSSSTAAATPAVPQAAPAPSVN